MTEHDLSKAGLDRRHFLAGVGAAGLATGTSVLPWTAAEAAARPGAAKRPLGLAYFVRGLSLCVPCPGRTAPEPLLGAARCAG